MSVQIEVYSSVDDKIPPGTVFQELLEADQILSTGAPSQMGVRVTVFAMETEFSFTLRHTRGSDFIQACIHTLLGALEENVTSKLLMTNNFFIYALAQEETLESHH